MLRQGIARTWTDALMEKRRSNDASRILQNGWRQGSVLPQSLVERLISEYQIPSTILPRNECRKGWIGRFWSLLMQARIQARLTNGLNSSTDRWVVISQDCDLVQFDWAKEPYVELLRIQPANGDRLPPAWLQSPCEMQFDDPPGSKNQH